jgi:Rieske 2Fe-2S family protein
VQLPSPPGLAGLDAVLAPFGESRGLPGAAYTSDEVFAWERQRLFDGGWFCVGRSAGMAAGTRRAVTVGLESVVLTHDGDVLRGFANVCRHRGHEVLEAGAEASGPVVQCPYHGWVYGLDGRLRGAPGFRGDQRLDPEGLALAAVPLAQWHGWVFANAGERAAAFESWTTGLEEHVAPYAPSRLRSGARTEYEVRANWKLIHENYHECYHCSNIHPELCRVTPPDSGRNLDPGGAWVGGVMDLMDQAETMSLDGRSGGVALPGLDARRRREVLYVGLIPNLLISLHPDYVLSHRLEPLGPDVTRVECEWLFSPEALERDGFDPGYAVEFWDLVNRQDWSACESVQRGVSSRAYRPGPLSAREDAVYRFLTMIARAYVDGRVAPPRTAPAAAARR